MPELWTSEVIAKMHLHRITQKELAKTLGWTPAYLDMILNGKREPKHAESSVRSAMEKIIKEEREG